MSIYDASSFQDFFTLARRGCAQGWHEANGGNISYRLLDEDVQELERSLSFDSAKHPLPFKLSNLAGEAFMVTASGAYLLDLEDDPSSSMGIIAVSKDGLSWQKLWGFENNARPTSELASHLLCHDSRIDVDPATRVVYHAHTPNIISLSLILEADEQVWSRIIWKTNTESILVFPDGIGVLDLIMPGSIELAQATKKSLASHSLCVWSLHGILATAKSCTSAFGTVQTLEKAAGIYLQALASSSDKDSLHLMSDHAVRSVAQTFNVKIHEDFLN